MKDSVPAPLPSLTYLHMEIGEGGGLVRWGRRRLPHFLVYRYRKKIVWTGAASSFPPPPLYPFFIIYYEKSIIY